MICKSRLSLHSLPALINAACPHCPASCGHLLRCAILTIVFSMCCHMLQVADEDLQLLSHKLGGSRELPISPLLSLFPNRSIKTPSSLHQNRRANPSLLWLPPFCPSSPVLLCCKFLLPLELPTYRLHSTCPPSHRTERFPVTP